MRISQSSVIAPLLFNILIHDLPNAVSDKVTVAQYADDICMRMDVTLKKATKMQDQNHIHRFYQSDLDGISNYMFENWLEFSPEKMHMILFNSGDGSQIKPIFKLFDNAAEYVNSVKFLKIFLTSKFSRYAQFNLC